jgi:CDGSH-type Zn-finger protein
MTGTAERRKRVRRLTVRKETFQTSNHDEETRMADTTNHLCSICGQGNHLPHKPWCDRVTDAQRRHLEDEAKSGRNTRYRDHRQATHHAKAG